MTQLVQLVAVWLFLDAWTVVALMRRGSSPKSRPVHSGSYAASAVTVTRTNRSNIR